MSHARILHGAQMLSSAHVAAAFARACSPTAAPGMHVHRLPCEALAFGVSLAVSAGGALSMLPALYARLIE